MRTGMRERNSFNGIVFVLPSLLGFTIFYALPFIKSIYYCFTTGIGHADFCGLDNFISLFKSGSYSLAVINTLRFNAIAVPAIMAASFFLALILRRSFKGKDFFNTTCIFPLVVPVASIVLFWQIIFEDKGTLNSILAGLKLRQTDWLDTGWSVAVLVLLYIWKNCGYDIILFTSGLGGIPEECYESARIDGAGRLACLCKITLPYIIPTSLFVFVISIVNSFKVFREAYLLAGSYPNRNIYLLQHFMNNNFANLNYQRLATSAFIMAFTVYLIVLLMFRIEKRFEDNL